MSLRPWEARSLRGIYPVQIQTVYVLQLCNLARAFGSNKRLSSTAVRPRRSGDRPEGSSAGEDVIQLGNGWNNLDGETAGFGLRGQAISMNDQRSGAHKCTLFVQRASVNTYMIAITAMLLFDQALQKLYIPGIRPL
jgi:hypothetical protein